MQGIILYISIAASIAKFSGTVCILSINFVFSFKKQVREALTSGPLHAVEIAREVKIARNFKPCIDLCKEAIENAYQEIKKICVYVRLEIFWYTCVIFLKDVNMSFFFSFLKKFRP